MDLDEYRRAVDDHMERVHNYAAWMLRDREEARDITQEALVRLWENAPRVRCETARAWLLRVTRNLCIDRMRRRKARPTASLDAHPFPLAHGSPGPERRVAASESADSLARALEELSERDRTLILLREMEGLSYDEIAEAMDMPMGTLKAALHRARHRLREALLERGVQP